MRQRTLILGLAGLLALSMVANAFEHPTATADNAELARLYAEDQKDQEAGPNANIDWAAVSKRNVERRDRVLMERAASGRTEKEA